MTPLCSKRWSAPTTRFELRLTRLKRSALDSYCDRQTVLVLKATEFARIALIAKSIARPL